MDNGIENEGFCMLDDFVCQAILGPGVPQADPTKQGKNEGINVGLNVRDLFIPTRSRKRKRKGNRE